MRSMSAGSLVGAPGGDSAAVVGRLDESTHVGTIEIRRPPHNFFDGDALARAVELSHELHEQGARALVLCSEGRNFCAGADFTLPTGTTGRGDVYELGLQLLAQPLPIVVAMQGKTIGGGVGLALVGDFRVASPQSTVWINFAKLGLHHGFGLSVTLPRLVGHQAAASLLLTARVVDGKTALRIGLCDHLVPAGRLRAEAHAFASEIAANGPLATLAIRQTLRGQLAEEATAAMSLERAVQQRLMATDDFREGVAAVNEDRPPLFLGR